MKVNKYPWGLLSFFLFALFLFPGGKQENFKIDSSIPKTGETVEGENLYYIEGTVRQVGSSPFIKLIIEDSRKHRYFFQGMRQIEEYSKFIGNRISLESTLKAEEIYSADGKYITTEYHLLDPKLINP